MLTVLILLLFGGAPAPLPASHVPGVDFIDRPISLQQALRDDWPETGRETGPERRPRSIYALPRPQSTGWIRWDEVVLAGLDGPLAVRTAGPFSARVYWNGALIGEKGVPGPDAASEIAGPIDAVFALPPDLIRERGNRLVMEYSSHHAGYEPMTVIHALRVMPYRADDRRPLRNYLPLSR